MPEYEIRVTVDAVVFSMGADGLEILLVKRRYEPFKGLWALPGGFVTEADKSLADAVRRELLEETNVSDVFLEQLYTFGDQDRDPRGRTVTVAYMALVISGGMELIARTDAAGVAWWPVKALPELAFDHLEIAEYALQRLKYKLEYSSAAFNLLPPKFTLRELQDVYEAVLGRDVDNRNFRKKFLGAGILEKLDEKSQAGSNRPASLFRFDSANFEQLPDRPNFVF